MLKLCDRLVELKDSKGYLQKDIAKSSGMSLRTYQRYEKGQVQPTLPVLIALADFFDISIDYLVGRSDDPTRH